MIVFHESYNITLTPAEIAENERGWLNDFIEYNGTDPRDFAAEIMRYTRSQGLPPLTITGHDELGITFESAVNDNSGGTPRRYELPWKAVQSPDDFMLSREEVAAGIALWLKPIDDPAIAWPPTPSM